MKKLLILTSVVMIACGLRAAVYDWGFSGTIKDLNSEGQEKRYKDGTAFLYIGTIAATESAFTGLDAAKFVISGGYDSTTYFYGKFDESLSSDLVSTSEKQDYTLILIQKKDATEADLANYEGKYLLTTGESVIANIPGAGSSYYATFGDSADYLTGDWKTMAVPEPTSGLLLLLGVAGLALRRRRA